MAQWGTASSATQGRKHTAILGTERYNITPVFVLRISQSHAGYRILDRAARWSPALPIDANDTTQGPSRKLESTRTAGLKHDGHCASDQELGDWRFVVSMPVPMWRVRHCGHRAL
jgi:hypothetical protein